MPCQSFASSRPPSSTSLTRHALTNSLPRRLGPTSYSLNTDIRNSQDVLPTTQVIDGDSLSVTSERSDRPGRKFAAAAHKRYTVVGKTSEAQAATQESLLVELRSKAKRVDDMGREYYIRDEIMPFDEDQRHEFKGHRSLAYDEQSQRTRYRLAMNNSTVKRTRKPVSVALNAFLNSRVGGTIFLGIIDTGAIKGLLLTASQRDHFRGQIEDLFSRYRPPVPSNRFKITFVPVIEGDDIEAEIEGLEATECDISGDIDSSKKPQRPHKFRIPQYCWCDKEAVGLLDRGKIPNQFVIEIEIFPWKCEGLASPPIAPVYEDEVGRVFFRTNASNFCPLVSEILEDAKHQVDTFFLKRLDRRKRETGESQKMQVGSECHFDEMKSRLGLNIVEKTMKQHD